MVFLFIVDFFTMRIKRKYVSSFLGVQVKHSNKKDLGVISRFWKEKVGGGIWLENTLFSLSFICVCCAILIFGFCK